MSYIDSKIRNITCPFCLANLLAVNNIQIRTNMVKYRLYADLDRLVDRAFWSERILDNLITTEQDSAT